MCNDRIRAAYITLYAWILQDYDQHIIQTPKRIIKTYPIHKIKQFVTNNYNNQNLGSN